MKLFLYELLKILKNRAFVILIIIMLCANAVAYNFEMSYVAPKETLRFNYVEPLSILFREYNKDPDLILKTANLVAEKIKRKWIFLQRQSKIVQNTI